MAKLRSSNIEPSTGTTLALGASGDAALISSDSFRANTWQDLGGNALFTSDGAGNISNVNSSLAGGGWVKVQTLTASSSSSLEFTTLIDSTYAEYIFLWYGMSFSSNGAELQMHTSSDGGDTWGMTATTAQWYSYHNPTGGEQAGWTDTTSTWGLSASTNPIIVVIDIPSASTAGAAGIMHFYNPSSTVYAKNFWCLQMHTNPGNAAQVGSVSGYIKSASAVNGIKFFPSTGNIATGNIVMYGVS